MTPEAVIFESGNVSVEWQPERYYTGFYVRGPRPRGFARSY